MSIVDLSGLYPGFRFSMFLLPQLTRAKVVVETGLGGGASTEIWLQSLDRMPDPASRVLHTFEMSPLQSTIDEVRSKKHGARWELHVCDDREPAAAAMLPQGTKIDLLYLDAGHDLWEVEAELRNFGPMVAETGAVLTDDSWRASGATETYIALERWASGRGWSTFLLKENQGQTVCFKV